MKSKKAQSAIEFVILVGVVTFFFASFMLVLQANIYEKNWEKINHLTKEIALNVQNEIDIASKAIDGYRREFEIPAKIQYSDYEISIVDSFVYVKTNDDLHALSLPAAEVIGQPIKGVNVIRKTNGEVFLN